MIFLLEREERFFFVVEAYNYNISQQTCIPALRKNLLPWISRSKQTLQRTMQVSTACLYCFQCPALYLFLRRWPFLHLARNFRRLAVNQNRYRFAMLPWSECATSFQPDGRTNSIKNRTPDKPRLIQPLDLQPWTLWSNLYLQIHYLSFMALPWKNIEADTISGVDRPV